MYNDPYLGRLNMGAFARNYEYDLFLLVFRC